MLFDYLRRTREQNPSFFYSIHENTNNILWIHPTFTTNYNHFGDTVRLHVAHPLPFVSISGLNHHAQPLLFACGLLQPPATSSSYTWLLHTWLHAAVSGNNLPVSITTPPDHAIQIAVQQVMPQTHLRFNLRTIVTQTVEKLPPSFCNEFRKCVHRAETVHEFESCWQALVRRHSVTDNEWLRSIYNARHRWVPAYMNQTFFGLFQEEDDEEEDMFLFNGYVDSTTSIQLLVKHYESALTSCQEMELKADFETAAMMPVLKTPSPMEKQAASVYTTRVFLKFQEELVETLANQATKLDKQVDEEEETTYRVAEFGGDQQEKKAYIVRFNSVEMKAVCSCHMFEFSGIICRHCLSVFRAQNVVTLPSQYILKRWTRDAKREYVPQLLLSSSDNCEDSFTIRHDNLRHVALKFVEEGAKSVHIYNTALDALQLAANKVDASKKQRAGVILNGGNKESKGEKEKKIQELTTELQNTNEQCQVYRANLVAVLRDMEEQKLKLSVKVQNARLSFKE